MKPFTQPLLFLFLALVMGTAIAGARPTVILNDPAFPFFHTTALDQPRLYGLLTDGGQVMQDANGPVVFRSFIDTGSSGFVLSNLHASTHEFEVASFNFNEEVDYIGTYTNLGIGGEEVGSVSRPFGILLYNDPFPSTGQAPIEEFDAYGDHSLWVRQAPGIGEVTLIPIEGFGNYELVSPVNIVGMPVIEQRVMVMQWMDIPEELIGLLPEEAKEMRTKLLPPGHLDIPPTNITLDIEMRDFIGQPRPGETLPSVSRNPMVKNITISHDPDSESLTASWLFDTGAGSSFISFAWAQQIGLISPSYPDLPTFLMDHIENEGLTSQVGGIGGDVVNVPILTLHEIRIPAREGFDIVWQNARVLIFDHPELAALGLEGIFGMNLIGPAATVDSNLLEGGTLADDLLFAILADITPTPFTSIVFEVTGEETGELRLFSSHAIARQTSYTEWRNSRFDPEIRDDPAFSGPQADPDNDGIPNLLEYALARDPMTPSRLGLPLPDLLEIDGGQYLSLSFDRIKGAVDLEFVIEASPGLTEWLPQPTVLVSVSDLDETRERVTLRDHQPFQTTNRRFLRLRVNLLEVGPE